MSCILCDTERIDDEAYGRIFAAYGQGPRRGLKARAAGVAAEITREIAGQTSIDDEGVWRHFAYHRRPQPPPAGYLKRDRSLQELHAARLSRRQLDILRLTCQLDALSTPQLLPLLYGSLATLGARRAACYRDLRALVRGQFLYRSHPPRRRIPQAHPGGPAAFLHPGREAIAWSEQVLGHTPSAVTAPGEIDWDLVQQRQRANDIVTTLAGALPGAAFRFGKDAGRVSITAGNWYGPGVMSADVHDPFSRTTRRSQPDGMIAVGIEVPVREIGALFPLAYIDDRPGWDEENLTDAIRDWAARMTTPQGRGAPFADLEPLVIPLLVVSPDAGRASEAQAAIGRALSLLPSGSRPPVLVVARPALALAWTDAVVATVGGEERPLQLAITDALPAAQVLDRLPLSHRLTAHRAGDDVLSDGRRRERPAAREEVWSGPLQTEPGRRRRSGAGDGPTSSRRASTS